MSPADKLFMFGRQSKLALLLLLVHFNHILIWYILCLLIDASIDLMSGYWQAKIPEKDREKTAFACHRALI